MEKESIPNDGLEVFFDAARETRPEVDPALFASILQDAETAKPEPPNIAVSKPSRWIKGSGAWRLFGGWPSAGLLTACLVVGVSLGYATPESLGFLTETILSGVGLDATGSYYLSLDGLMVEG